MSQTARKYGLIGYPLSHSFSPAYFEQKFKAEHIQASYQLFPLEHVEHFIDLTKNNSLAGLNVTIPYKKQIIPYLDQLSDAAAAVGAVNCISFKGSKLIGYNTDVIGFEKSLQPLLKPQHKRALILGTGGAAQAVAYVLQKMDIAFQFVSTKKSCKYLNYTIAAFHLVDFPLIINTTPLGMFPKIDESPFEELIGVDENHLIYDLIYNPEETKLLQMAKQQGAQIKNGLEMLEIQAEESWSIWNKK